MALTILHLSDLHIGRAGLDLSKLSDAIVFALSQNKERIEQIAVTGDIFDGKALSEDSIIEEAISSAVNFFSNLLKGISEIQDINLIDRDILFVPGNHEINKKEHKDSYFNNYKKFLEKFYTKEYDFIKFKNFSLLKKFTDEKIIIIGLNSSRFDNGKSFGSVSLSDFTPLNLALSKFNKDDYSIVVMLHHHFYKNEERNKSYVDESTLVNHETFFEMFCMHNITTILHGHRHNNAVHRININVNPKEKDKMVNVVACGATGKDDVYTNYFNVVKIYEPNAQNSVIISEYKKSQRDVFTFENKYVLPVNVVSKHITPLRQLLAEESDLYEFFKNIISFGNDSSNYIKILEGIIGSCSDTCAVLEKNKESIFFMFLTAHYRANQKNDINLKSIEKEVKKHENIPKHDFFISIQKSKNIYDFSKEYSKNIISKIEKSTKKEKEIITFCIISFFICDFFFTLNNNSGEFFKIKIKNNTDFNVDPNEIASGIRNNQVEISFDEDRRALEVKVECTQAISHKVVKLIVNEYEYMLSEYEKLFSEVGFKMYYIIGNIFGTDKNETELESYTFKAYTRTLLNLLAGEHIYANKMVFIREALQNCIDAIHLRNKIDKKYHTQESKIEIISETHEHGNHSLSIKDNGVGMTKYHIERYLTTIGRSFYKSEEFANATHKNSYHPISQFGIGFLSCFNVSKSINVSTKYWDEEIDRKAYCLEIPNIDGCFFIENKGHHDVGTIVKLEISKEIQIERLKEYIKTTFFDSNYDIFFDGKLIVPKNALINRLNEETSEFKLNFFIPLGENGTIKESHNAGMNYGIYIFKRDNKLFCEPKCICLCNGIKISNFDMPEEFKPLHKDYFDIIFNLPSNLLELEVSRDALKKFNLKFDKKFNHYLKNKIKNFISGGLHNKLPIIILMLISPYIVNKKHMLVKFDSKNYSVVSYVTDTLTNEHRTELAEQFFSSLLKYINKSDIPLEKKYLSNKFEQIIENEFMSVPGKTKKRTSVFINKIIENEKLQNSTQLKHVTINHINRDFLNEFFYTVLHRNFDLDIDEFHLSRRYVDLFFYFYKDMPTNLSPLQNSRIALHVILYFMLLKYFLKNEGKSKKDKYLTRKLFSKLCFFSLIFNTFENSFKENIILNKESIDIIAEALEETDDFL